MCILDEKSSSYANRPTHANPIPKPSTFIPLPIHHTQLHTCKSINPIPLPTANPPSPYPTIQDSISPLRRISLAPSQSTPIIQPFGPNARWAKSQAAAQLLPRRGRSPVRKVPTSLHVWAGLAGVYRWCCARFVLGFAFGFDLFGDLSFLGRRQYKSKE